MGLLSMDLSREGRAFICASCAVPVDLTIYLLRSFDFARTSQISKIKIKIKYRFSVMEATHFDLYEIYQKKLQQHLKRYI